MRIFLTISLFVHAASLAFFMWHKQQDKKIAQPPMSAMVQIVSLPDELEPEEIEPPIDITAPKSEQTKKITKKPKTKKILPKTLSRKGPSAAELEYAQELTAYIERNRFYPKRAWRLKKQGTVVISLTILNNGDFAGVRLIEASQHKILDASAVDFLTTLKKFKPLPNTNIAKREYIVPIFYKIGR